MTETVENNKFVYTTLDRLISLKYDIRGFSYLPKQPVQSQLTGKHRSRLRGRGLDFEEVRAYNFGDDIRNIDWKVTARTKKPHTKVYTEERERPVFIIVDQSASMFFGTQKYMKSVIAAEGAAISAWKVLAVGDRVGGIVFNDEKFVEVKQQRNQKAVLRLLNVINEKNNNLTAEGFAHQKFGMLNQILEQTLKYVTHDYLVVIFSDFNNYDSNTIKALKQISRHNDIIAAIIKDPLELNLDKEMIVGVGEKQINLSEIDLNSKLKFKKESSSDYDRLKKDLTNYGITPLSFNTNESSLFQLRKILGRKR